MAITRKPSSSIPPGLSHSTGAVFIPDDLLWQLTQTRFNACVRAVKLVQRHIRFFTSVTLLDRRFSPRRSSRNPVDVDSQPASPVFFDPTRRFSDAARTNDVRNARAPGDALALPVRLAPAGPAFFRLLPSRDSPFFVRRAAVSARDGRDLFCAA
jgi:hypothetical protein